MNFFYILNRRVFIMTQFVVFTVSLKDLHLTPSKQTLNTQHVTSVGSDLTLFACYEREKCLLTYPVCSTFIYIFFLRFTFESFETDTEHTICDQCRSRFDTFCLL